MLVDADDFDLADLLHQEGVEVGRLTDHSNDNVIMPAKLTNDYSITIGTNCPYVLAITITITIFWQ